MKDNYPNGYYWAENPSDDTRFIALQENGLWYCCGLFNPIDLDTADIIAPVAQLEGWEPKYIN
jgi:hypothetical protein